MDAPRRDDILVRQDFAGRLGELAAFSADQLGGTGIGKFDLGLLLGQKNLVEEPWVSD